VYFENIDGNVLVEENMANSCLSLDKTNDKTTYFINMLCPYLRRTKGCILAMA